MHERINTVLLVVIAGLLVYSLWAHPKTDRFQHVGGFIVFDKATGRLCDGRTFSSMTASTTERKPVEGAPTPSKLPNKIDANSLNRAVENAATTPAQEAPKKDIFDIAAESEGSEASQFKPIAFTPLCSEMPR